MIQIVRFTSEQVIDHLDEFTLMLCRTVDLGASIGWLAPLSPAEAAAYWRSVAAQVKRGDKIILAAQVQNRIVSTAQLALEPRENGNHRAEVQKLMVHPDWRRRGIARLLMQNLDAAARQAQRSLLVLDVRKGDPAETLYQKLGYVHAGDIPSYCRNNHQGLDATALYYKLL